MGHAPGGHAQPHHPHQFVCCLPTSALLAVPFFLFFLFFLKEGHAYRLVTVGAFALTACIVPASFFGMNLNHGLEVRSFYMARISLEAAPPVVWCAVGQAWT